MDYEYTVVEPFSLGTKTFRVGDRLIDQHLIDEALAGGHSRNLTRHAVLTPKHIEQRVEQREEAAPITPATKP